MNYEEYPPERFYSEIADEASARQLLWRAKCDGCDFLCERCGSVDFFQYRSRAEIRKCKKCGRQIRLRAGSIFDSSKTSLLLWVKAIFYVTQSKRGISALELQKHLGIKSYGLVWSMLQKIRDALAQRDDLYQLSGTIELDGAVFGRRLTGTQTEVLFAVESKEYKDKRDKIRTKAGFAKVLVAKETRENTQAFVDKEIEIDSLVNTDGAHAFRKLTGIDLDYQKMNKDGETLDRWLPWIHKLISNSKTWINGTHHGVSAKHLKRYLGEYVYRYNRRFDEARLFHRAVYACIIAKPVRLGALR